MSAVLLIGLSVHVGHTIEGLSPKASEGDEGGLYDVNNVVSYYVESMGNKNTLIYSHYTQETSPDVVVTCLDCHDIETLRKLYSTCNQEFLDDINSNVLDSTMDICFECHGSYNELIVLTESYEGFQDSKGTIVNPHDTMLGESPCYNCHSSHSGSDPVTTGLNFCYKCHLNKVLGY